MTMAIKAVAWDIDGTLIDSEPLHHRALIAGTSHFGVDIADVPEERFRGVHMRGVWQGLNGRLPAALTYEDWLERIHDCYIAEAVGLRAIEGALEAIDAVAGMGLAQVCVSNSGRRIVDANIAALGLSEKLRFSISVNDVARGKPDPEPYLAAAGRLGLRPAEVAAVEDSLTGAAAARAAGMTVIGYGLAGEAIDHPLDRYADLPAVLRPYL